VAHTSNPSYFVGKDQEDHSSRPHWAKSKTLSQKYPTQKWAGRVAQVVQCLPGKCEALSSNPNTTKKKKKKSRHWDQTMRPLALALVLTTWL
jgi:hypothetical protein